LYEFAFGLGCRVACSPDGRLGAVGSSFGTVLAWDLQRRTPVYYFGVADGGVSCNPVCFTPDGTGLITGGCAPESVQLWKVI
jgi:WD40 repeat protein